MRTLSAAQDKALRAAAGRSVHTRVWVKDGGGTWRNLSSFEGYDWVVGATYGEGVDQPVRAASVSLFRDRYQLSLAALMSSSKLNAKYGGKLVYIGRAIKIETATIASGTEPGVSDWVNVFEGTIDDVDWGSDPIQVSCLDEGGTLQRRTIETELVYGLGLTVGVARWTASTAVALGRKVVPTNAAIAYYWQCTSAGNTGATEPDWNSYGGAAFWDGTVQWTRVGSTLAGGPVETQMQAILDDVLGAGIVTMLVSGAPSWSVTKWLQDRGPVLDALRALAAQIGWDVRYRWHAGSSSFRLTFYEPDRAKVVADRTFGPNDYDADGIKTLKVSLPEIRNAVHVIYYDTSVLDAAGQPSKRTISVEDAASIAANGRMFCEIGEASTSNIDTATEATRLANAVLSDLKDPIAEQLVQMDYFWPAEVGDLYTFSANGVHYDTDQTLAVVAVQHELSRDGSKTTLTCRGRPAGGHDIWLEREARPGAAAPTTDQPPDGPQSPTATAVFGGADVSYVQPPKGFTVKDGEIHISGSSGFTPSSSTLFESGRKTKFQVRGITPGTTRYARLVVKDARGLVSMSPELQFTADFIKRSDLAAALKTGFRAVRNADASAETGGSGSTPKQAQLNSEAWDVGAGYNPATSRFTAPETGIYHVRGQVVLAGVQVGDLGNAFLKKNGSTTAATGPSVYTAVDPTALTTRLSMVVDAKVSLSAGDYLELWYTTYTPNLSSATLVAASSFFEAEETLES